MNKEKVCSHPKTQSGTATCLPSQKIARFKKYRTVEGTSGCLKTCPDGQTDTSVVDQQKLAMLQVVFGGFA